MDGLRDSQALLLPVQTPTNKPCKNARCFLSNGFSQCYICLPLIWCLGVCDKTQVKLDQTSALPESLIFCVCVWLIVRHEEQFMCRKKCILSAVDLAGRYLFRVACQVFHL